MSNEDFSLSLDIIREVDEAWQHDQTFINSLKADMSKTQIDRFFEALKQSDEPLKDLLWIAFLTGYFRGYKHKPD